MFVGRLSCLGVSKVLLRQDLRPWLIELNPGPAMGIDQRVRASDPPGCDELLQDPMATELRADVMEARGP